MDKPNRLESQSADGVQLNLDALYQIAPSCFTEALDAKTGEVKRKVDFNTLRQLLGDNAVENAPEAYMFNWVGKQAARAEVLRPTKKTLRPVKEDSVDWDNTQNLYIEGDNLEVLKLLQKSYLGKVKMIYIDPPYNTGNDFIYHDNFARTQAEEDLFAGNVDELGNRYIKNTDSNGRYHSDWCSMIYSRLMVARTLLSEDGVIFISIDDNEVENLRKVCDEIFGAVNYIGQVVVVNNPKGRNDSKHFAICNEYAIVYGKKNYETHGLPLSDEQLSLFDKEDENGNKYQLRDLRKRGNADKRSDRPNMFFPIYFEPNTKQVSLEKHDEWIEILPIKGDGSDGRWRWGRERVESYLSLIVPKQVKGKDRWGVEYKIYLNPKLNPLIDDEDEILSKPKTVWQDSLISSDIARRQLKALMEANIFDFPKSIELIKRFAQVGSDKSSIILDFFSGSATTAHAVMQLNAEDGGKRKYIMVQIPEETPEDSEARKAGYKTIPEIGKERIRRAGKKIKEDSPLTTQDLDTGFRVFRLDEGNFENVEFSPNDLQQEALELFLNNIKSDRNDLDLLFGCMLDWGVQLSLPMTSEVVDGKTIYTVNDGDLVACFAENVTDDVVRAMANKMPLRVIFRDSCFAQDADKINIYETFKQLLDWSDQEVIKNIRVI